MTTAKEYRKMAEDAEQQSADSFERCDTDGFLSQWASGLTAQKYRLQANIEDNGGAAWFVGLYAGSERVPAKQIPTPCTELPGCCAMMQRQSMGALFLSERRAESKRNEGFAKVLKLQTRKQLFAAAGAGLAVQPGSARCALAMNGAWMPKR